MENLKALIKRARDCLYVLKWGVQSRVLVMLLQVVFHGVIPDHAHSMNDVTMRAHRGNPHDIVTETLLGGFDNWDSEYYIFIAERGYTTLEESMAFFPLYPLLIRVVASTLFYPLTLFISLRSVLLASGVLINFVVFPLAAAVLYLLTLDLTRNRRLAFLAALLFCLNPAGVFMSAVYTETIFAFFSFSGMLLTQYKRTWLAALCFSCASATRSNGIALIGFLGYSCLATILSRWQGGQTCTLKRAAVDSVRNLFTACVQALIILAPFIVFQAYGFTVYCNSSYSSKMTSNTMLDNATSTHLPNPTWCEWSVPLPYSYIQQHYWGVGFLQYYQWKQLPNFILAAPTVVVCLLSVWRYCTLSNAATTAAKEEIITGSQLRPYALHFVFLLIFGIFNMHIQVLTRFISSSSPLLYCFTAEAILRVFADLKITRLIDPSLYRGHVIARSVARALFKMDTSRVSRVTLFWSRLAACYFPGYIVIGCALHCNFYPWT